MSFTFSTPNAVKSTPVRAHVKVDSFMKATESNMCRKCRGNYEQSELRSTFGKINSNCIPDSITGNSRCPYKKGKA